MAVVFICNDMIWESVKGMWGGLVGVVKDANAVHEVRKVANRKGNAAFLKSFLLKSVGSLVGLGYLCHRFLQLNLTTLSRRGSKKCSLQHFFGIMQLCRRRKKRESDRRESSFERKRIEQ